MGFLCPICHKDFGLNKNWFTDHIKAHYYEQQKEKVIIVTKEQNIANLKSIQNAIKSDKIRVWMNFDGLICFKNMKTKKEIRLVPYYDLDGEVIRDN